MNARVALIALSTPLFGQVEVRVEGPIRAEPGIEVVIVDSAGAVESGRTDSRGTYRPAWKGAAIAEVVVKGCQEARVRNLAIPRDARRTVVVSMRSCLGERRRGGNACPVYYRVTDESGAPVPGAVVATATMTRTAGSFGGASVSLRVGSSEDIEIRASGLAPYRERIVCPQFDEIERTVILRGRGDGSTASPAPGSESDPVLEITVRDTLRAPLDGVPVEVQSSSGDMLVRGFTANGRFRILDLPFGVHSITVGRFRCGETELQGVRFPRQRGETLPVVMNGCQ